MGEKKGRGIGAPVKDEELGPHYFQPPGTQSEQGQSQQCAMTALRILPGRRCAVGPHTHHLLECDEKKGAETRATRSLLRLQTLQ